MIVWTCVKTVQLQYSRSGWLEICEEATVLGDHFMLYTTVPDPEATSPPTRGWCGPRILLHWLNERGHCQRFCNFTTDDQSAFARRLARTKADPHAILTLSVL